MYQQINLAKEICVRYNFISTKVRINCLINEYLRVKQYLSKKKIMPPLQKAKGLIQT